MTAAAAGLLCSVCRHPDRRHNAAGCLVDGCWCNGDAPAVSAVPVPPPSDRTLDLLDPVCGRCPHRRGKHAITGHATVCQRCSCRGFTPKTGDADAVPTAPASDVPELAPAASTTGGGEEAAEADPAAGRDAGHGEPVELETPDDRPPSVLAVSEAEASTSTEASATHVDLASARTTPTPDAYLDPDLLFTHGLYVSVRWFCPPCREWPLAPGACVTCRAPLQPVYVATIPRELPS